MIEGLKNVLRNEHYTAQDRKRDYEDAHHSIDDVIEQIKELYDDDAIKQLKTYNRIVGNHEFYEKFNQFLNGTDLSSFDDAEDFEDWLIDQEREDEAQTLFLARDQSLINKYTPAEFIEQAVIDYTLDKAGTTMRTTETMQEANAINLFLHNALGGELYYKILAKMILEANNNPLNYFTDDCIFDDADNCIYWISYD